MKVRVTEGLNRCSIGLSDIGSYLKFDYPLTVVWHDCRGSVAKYFAGMPYNEEYRKTVEERIQKGVQKEFTGEEEQLYEMLKPLFSMFKNGEYELSYYSNKEKEFFRYTTSLDKHTKMHYEPLEVVFPEKQTITASAHKISETYAALVRNKKQDSKYSPVSLIEQTTDSIYPGFHSFFATQPYQKIDQNRVRYFEERIRKGERPFAILYYLSMYEQDLYSSYFILDGHHKLLAYKNLGMYPPLTIIEELATNPGELEFDAEHLSEHLYPWQMDHIMENWEEKDAYLEQVLQNPDSRLHPIVNRLAEKKQPAVPTQKRSEEEDSDTKSPGPQEGFWKKLKRFF